MSYIIPVLIILASAYVIWHAGKRKGAAEQRTQITVPPELHETKDPTK